MDKKIKQDMCEYCDGEIEETKVRMDYRIGEKLVVIENVPVRVCRKCGERYYDAAVLKRLDAIANQKGKPKKVISVPVKLYDEAVSF